MRKLTFRQNQVNKVSDSNEELREFFNLSAEEFARLIGSASGEIDRPISQRSKQTVENLRLIKESLEAQFEKEEIDRWLHAPSPMFDDRTPIEAMAAGEVELILQELIRLEEGIPG